MRCNMTYGFPLYVLWGISLYNRTVVTLITTVMLYLLLQPYYKRITVLLYSELVWISSDLLGNGAANNGGSI